MINNSEMETTSHFIFPKVKKRIIRRPSRIAATASFFPDKRVTNQDIIDANGLAVAARAIEKSLGVAERRTSGSGIVDSDLLANAAQLCLNRAGVTVDQLDRLFVTKFLGDHILPMTAAMVQRKLGATTTFHAVDIEGGINAFLSAFDLAVRCISTSRAERQYILIVSGGVNVAPISKTDPRTAFLFGDGAAAILLTNADEPHVLASYQYSNGAYYNTTGSRRLKMDQWVSQKLYEQGDYQLLYDLYEMENWKDSADFYIQAARVTRDNLIAESGLEMNDIDFVLITENNKRLRDMTLEALGVPEEKSLSLIKEYGNTMSAMLPLLFDEALNRGLVKSGMHVMLISHGEGATGGGLIYKV